MNGKQIKALQKKGCNKHVHKKVFKTLTHLQRGLLRAAILANPSRDPMFLFKFQQSL